MKFFSDHLLALFSFMVCAVLQSEAHAATQTYRFYDRGTKTVPAVSVATLTIEDVSGGATRWTLSASWDAGKHPSYLDYLDYDYRGRKPPRSYAFQVMQGAVAAPNFANLHTKKKAVRFQSSKGAGQFQSGEQVRWMLANSRAADFQINAIYFEGFPSSTAGIFQPVLSVAEGPVSIPAPTPKPTPVPTPAPPIAPPIPTSPTVPPVLPKIPVGTVSRDFSESVGGVDANRNGVRDDIEEFIAKKYTDRRQQSALFQYAAEEQNFLLNSSTKQTAFLGAKKVYRGLDCAILIFGEDDFDKQTDQILAMTLNTKARAIAYQRARSNSAGQLYDVGVHSPCDQIQ